MICSIFYVLLGIMKNRKGITKLNNKKQYSTACFSNPYIDNTRYIHLQLHYYYSQNIHAVNIWIKNTNNWGHKLSVNSTTENDSLSVWKTIDISHTERTPYKKLTIGYVCI